MDAPLDDLEAVFDDEDAGATTDDDDDGSETDF
jgi:hypothetical protein